MCIRDSNRANSFRLRRRAAFVCAGSVWRAHAEHVGSPRTLGPFHRSAGGLWTVSYTHLDVYKRQLLDMGEERKESRTLQTKLTLRASGELVASGAAARRVHFFYRMSATIPISASVQSAVAEMLAELHAKSGCEKFGLSRQSFAAILCAVATKYLPAEASASEARNFLLTLRVDELALARACAAGDNSAWEIFLIRYREKLRLAALRIAREDSAARELADSLYAEL